MLESESKSKKYTKEVKETEQWIDGCRLVVRKSKTKLKQ